MAAKGRSCEDAAAGVTLLDELGDLGKRKATLVKFGDAKRCFERRKIRDVFACLELELNGGIAIVEAVKLLNEDSIVYHRQC